MSNIKLFKMLNALQNNNKSTTVTQATINIVDNTIELELNGTPSNIMINYEGAVFFNRKLPINFKTLVGKNIILIGNLLRKRLPKLILEYTGDLKIISCEITNFSGGKINATVNNNQLETIMNQSKTNMEDETAILFHQDEMKFDYNVKRGLNKLIIPKNNQRYGSRTKKYSEREIKEVESLILALSPSLVKIQERRKTRAVAVTSKPTVATPAKRQVRKKPTRSKY